MLFHLHILLESRVQTTLVPLWTQGKEEEEVEEEQLLAQEHRGGGGKRLSLDTGALFCRARALKKEEPEEVVGEKILAGE